MGETVERLSARGRTIRVALSVTLCAALACGALVGEDDLFPIGPFRMFATRQRLAGTVSWYEIRFVSTDGSETVVQGPEIGLRRAEIEGQRSRLLDDPRLLCEVAQAATTDIDLAEVRLVKEGRPLENGRPTGDTVEAVVATCVP